jgi:hypothetical protein
VHRRASTAALAALLAIALPAVARGADPHRWTRTAVTATPIVYWQGMTHDRAGHLYFDGIENGGHRTDRRLSQQLGADPLIPPLVTLAEGFDHVGDWTWIRAGGGRLVVPMECYDPGAPNGPNTCGRGAFGLTDANLRWLGRVLLDPRDIAKVMWAEASPDGSLIWTSSGADLLAYRTADLRPGAGDTPIRPVRRLARAVPPGGVTGATFVGRRLFLASQDRTAMRVWSVDPATGARRLEIERRWAGESEGLDHVRALGGVLHWQIQPLDPRGRPPTFGAGHGTIVSFLSARKAPVGLRAGARVRAARR